MSDKDTIWRVELELSSAAHLAIFEAALESLGAAVTLMEIGADGARGTGRWRVIGHGSAEPDRAELETRIALAAAGAGIAVPGWCVETLPDTDWVAAARREIEPVEAGRFFVHGSHHTEPPPAGAVTIQIDASMAFGSGEHHSTRGCLIAIDRMLGKRSPASVLDMGTGSGILAIALAKASDAVITAADNDPVAVAIAAGNAAINGVGARIRTLASDGFDDPAIANGGSYDWILANILARPLIELAPALVRHLESGGIAVLSGFLEEQSADVAAAYQAHGAGVIDDVVLEEWRTLVVERA